MTALLNSLVSSTLGPEHRWWMDPKIWCGWCANIHQLCTCDGGGAR